MRSKRTKALAISPRVKQIVWERDGRRCVLCGATNARPEAHYIPRSQSGLGIEENVVTLCRDCHRRLDQSVERKRLLETIKRYLDVFYPDFNDEDRRYKR